MWSATSATSSNYVFTVENTGNVTLTDVAVSDPNAAVSGGPITLTPTAPGNIDSATFTATHTITQDDVDAGQVANQATAEGTPPIGGPVIDLSDDPDTPAPDDPTIVPLNLG